MPKTNDTNLLKELTDLRSTYPWIMLVELSSTEDTIDFGNFSRLCSNTEEISWDGETWNPYPFVVGQVKSTSTGSLPKSSISFFNTTEFTRKVTPQVLGCDATVYFLNIKHKSEFTQDTYPIQFSFKVVGVTINEAVSFTLGAPNYLITKIPAKKYVRDYCNFTFLGEHCWLTGEAFTALRNADSSLPTVCNKSYPRCKQFWQSGTINLPEQTPPYIGFGGFPTIDKGDINYD